MAANDPTVKQKDGRKYQVDGSGIASLKRDYIVIQNATMGADGEATSFTGVPAIGSEHPNHAGLFVQTYDVQEGTGKDKNILTVTANYGTKTTETSGEGSSMITSRVDEWGWDDGTDEKELVEGVDGTAVVNSAGDPFESVPKVTVPAPVFTKVVSFASRQSGWASANCKVNNAEVTIGDQTFPVGSLLCTVAQKRIIRSPDNMKYQYTVRLRYKSNMVKIAGASTSTDIGWDVGIVDCGMKEINASGDKVLIRVKDKETGKMCTVTSATLLDGQGGKLADGEDPYNFRFQAYERASFPGWFYSEPT